MSCPYSDEELDFWDSVANPIGNACFDCDDLECEHNDNSENYYSYEDFEPVKEQK